VSSRFLRLAYSDKITASNNGQQQESDDCREQRQRLDLGIKTEPMVSVFFLQYTAHALLVRRKPSARSNRPNHDSRKSSADPLAPRVPDREEKRGPGGAGGGSKTGIGSVLRA
jgi:hypothetical protein